jgi:hypothetical protein
LQAFRGEQPTYDAVAVVQTPFQLLSATEACHHFGFARPLLYLLTSRPFPRERFETLLDRRDWAAVRCFEVGMARRPLLPVLQGTRLGERLTEFRWVLVQSAFRRRFEREFRRCVEVPNVVIGNYYNPDVKHLVNLLPRSRCILVDDGTDTLRIARARRDSAPASMPKKKPPFVLRGPRRWWHAKFVEWDTRERDEVTFFSSYDIHAAAGDRVVHNSYRRLRAGMRKPAVDDRCVFLGQPLVEDGYVSLDRYVDLMAKIKASIGAQKMIYVPHPREDRTILSASLAKLGIECREISKPFELYLLDADTVPGTLASFFCSALESCRALWHDTMSLVAFRIPRADLLVCREFVDAVYDYFAGTNAIRVVIPGQALDVGESMTDRVQTAPEARRTHRE